MNLRASEHLQALGQLSTPFLTLVVAMLFHAGRAAATDAAVRILAVGMALDSGAKPTTATFTSSPQIHNILNFFSS